MLRRLSVFAAAVALAIASGVSGVRVDRAANAFAWSAADVEAALVAAPRFELQRGLSERSASSPAPSVALCPTAAMLRRPGTILAASSVDVPLAATATTAAPRSSRGPPA